MWNTIIIILGSAAIIGTLILISFILANIVYYLYIEARHEIRNAKRSIKEAWWDLEWKLKR